MKLTNRCLAQFNQPATLAVISPYPKRGEVYSAGVTGVASYSKNVVKNLTGPVLVIANQLPHRHQKTTSKPVFYQEGSALIGRVWQPNTIDLWRQIITTLRQFPQLKKVLIHFDFAMYGNPLVTSLVIPFLWLLKFYGYQVSLVAHHVVLDVDKLTGHLGLSQSWFDQKLAKIYSKIFRLFFRLLGLSVTQIIVLEKILQKRLATLINPHKIVTIPHAVDDSLSGPTKAAARKILGIKANEQVVLFFGFVNWFKGADFFVDTFKDVTKLLCKPARFIIAGGKSPTMSGKPYYDKYFAQLTQTIDQSAKVELTGYIPQQKIALYFAACDLVVFPYRDFMCASGVMSLTFSYAKPFIVSTELATVLNEADYRQALAQVGLKKDDLIFKLTPTDLLNQATNVLADGIKPKTVAFTRLIRSSRAFSQTAHRYAQAIFATSKPKVLFSWANLALISSN